MERMTSDILNLHRDQLIAMGLPTRLHHSACEKIASQIFDAGLYFQFVQFQEVDDIDGSIHSDDEVEIDDETDLDPEFEGLRPSTSTRYSLTSCDLINSEDTVVLIDHMW